MGLFFIYFASKLENLRSRVLNVMRIGEPQ